MDWNTPPPDLFNRVLGPASEPAYGPNVTPSAIGELVSAPVDQAMARLRLYGKGAGDLPRPTMMRIGDAASAQTGRALTGVKRLIERYGSSPAPARPAPPKAPAFATDPEDRGQSMGVARMKPGGYY